MSGDISRVRERTCETWVDDWLLVSLSASESIQGTGAILTTL